MNSLSLLQFYGEWKLYLLIPLYLLGILYIGIGLSYAFSKRSMFRLWLCVKALKIIIFGSLFLFIYYGPHDIELFMLFLKLSLWAIYIFLTGATIIASIGWVRKFVGIPAGQGS